jgi:hypothetical protein
MFKKSARRRRLCQCHRLQLEPLERVDGQSGGWGRSHLLQPHREPDAHLGHGQEGIAIRGVENWPPSVPPSS